MSSHDMECFLKELLMILFMKRLMMSSIELFCCSSLRISMVMKSNNGWSTSLTDVSTSNLMTASNFLKAS